MNWPWHASARERYLEDRLKDLKHAEHVALARESYWRDRYERLADLMLVRQVNPNAVAPVHVDPPSNDIASLGARVGRVAGVLGSTRGIPFETLHHAKAAENPGN